MKYALTVDLIQSLYNYLVSRPFVEVEALVLALRKEVEENQKPAPDGDGNANS